MGCIHSDATYEVKMADPKYQITIETDNAAEVVKPGSSEGKVNLRFSVAITNRQNFNISLRISVQNQFVKTVNFPRQLDKINVVVDDFSYDKDLPLTVKVEQSARTNVCNEVVFPFKKSDAKKAEAVERVKVTPSKHMANGFVPVFVQTFDEHGKPAKQSVLIHPGQNYIINIGADDVESKPHKISQIETDANGTANILIRLMDQNGRVFFTEPTSGKQTALFMLKR